jgi:hypothetical protein
MTSTPLFSISNQESLVGYAEGWAPLISSTIRFASFLHFSPFYSPLAPLEPLRLSLAGDERHATIGGKRCHSINLFPSLRLLLWRNQGVRRKTGDPWSGAS